MAEKRKDSKGRLLRTGETQRQDGRYSYQYTDGKGQRCTVYSWTLNPSDRVPSGKKGGKSLREQEQEIEKMIADGICPANRKTVGDVVRQYCDKAVKGKADSTIHIYNCVLSHLEEQPIYRERITGVKVQQAKSLIDDMLEQNIGYSIVKKTKEVLKASFDMAIEDEIITRNPFTFQMPPCEKAKDERFALTEEQEREWLEFLLANKRLRKWYLISVVLLNTGLRISELLGLTVDDINFETHRIRVDHQLLCRYGKVGAYSGNHSGQFSIAKTKTKNGKREVPFGNTVEMALRELIEMRPSGQQEFSVGDWKGFILLNSNGVPYKAGGVDDRFKRMIRTHNKTCEMQLPSITPHILRHTYCTKMAYRGVNPKTLQYLMGHKTPKVTMAVYAHIDAERALKEFEKLSMD